MNKLQEIHIKNINDSKLIPESNQLINEINNSSNLNQLNLIFKKYCLIYKLRGIKYKFWYDVSKQKYKENNHEKINPYANEICEKIMNSKTNEEIDFIMKKYSVIESLHNLEEINKNYKSLINDSKSLEDIESIIHKLISSYQHQLEKYIDINKIAETLERNHYYYKLMKLNIPEINTDLIYKKDKLMKNIEKDYRIVDINEKYKYIKNELKARYDNQNNNLEESNNLNIDLELDLNNDPSETFSVEESNIQNNNLDEEPSNESSEIFNIENLTNEEVVDVINKLLKKEERRSIKIQESQKDKLKISDYDNSEIIKRKLIENRDSKIESFAYSYINNLSYRDIMDQVYTVIDDESNSINYLPDGIIEFGKKMRRKYGKI